MWIFCARIQNRTLERSDCSIPGDCAAGWLRDCANLPCPPPHLEYWVKFWAPQYRKDSLKLPCGILQVSRGILQLSHGILQFLHGLQHSHGILQLSHSILQLLIAACSSLMASCSSLMASYISLPLCQSHLRKLVDSMREAVFTVSPKRQ